VARSVTFTSFSLCLIVGALECRSETATVLTTATSYSKQLNWTLLAEFALAVLVTQMDVFNRLLDTTPVTLGQFGWALVPALTLLVLREAGKAVARRVEARRGRSPGASSTAPGQGESLQRHSIPVPRGRTSGAPRPGDAGRGS
jgi:P-type Ca2+ transporter type 2C